VVLVTLTAVSFLTSRAFFQGSFFEFRSVAYFILSVSILGIILSRCNIITTFLSIEMMFLSINFIFVIYSIFMDDILGQIYALLFLAVGSGETSIGLGILVCFYRVRKNIFVYSSVLKN
jgi:NADH-quinone oxidoreductase subunit K